MRYVRRGRLDHPYGRNRIYWQGRYNPVSTIARSAAELTVRNGAHGTEYLTTDKHGIELPVVEWDACPGVYDASVPQDWLTIIPHTTP